jgi:hypothetical protein
MCICVADCNEKANMKRKKQPGNDQLYTGITTNMLMMGTANCNNHKSRGCKKKINLTQLEQIVVTNCQSLDQQPTAVRQDEDIS